MVAGLWALSQEQILEGVMGDVFLEPGAERSPKRPPVNCDKPAPPARPPETQSPPLPWSPRGLPPPDPAGPEDRTAALGEVHKDTRSGWPLGLRAGAKGRWGEEKTENLNVEGTGSMCPFRKPLWHLRGKKTGRCVTGP